MTNILFIRLISKCCSLQQLRFMCVCMRCCYVVLERLAGVFGQHSDQHSPNRQGRAEVRSQLQLLHDRRQSRKTAQHHVHVCDHAPSTNS